MKKVLFICRYHEGRSPMAEAFLKKYGEGKFDVYSAGLEERGVDPLVEKAMEEKGLDVSNISKKPLKDYIRDSAYFGYVISLCDRNEEEDCPIYPGTPHREHWPIEAPDRKAGTEEERLGRIREIRDEIEEKVLQFIEEQK